MNTFKLRARAAISLLLLVVLFSGIVMPAMALSDTEAQSISRQMKANTEAWNSATDDATRNALAQENGRLAMEIANQMKANSDAWHTAKAREDVATCNALAAANETLAQYIRDAGGTACRTDDGRWVIQITGISLSSRSNGKDGHAEEVNYRAEDSDGKEVGETEKKGSHYYEESIEADKKGYEDSHPGSTDTQYDDALKQSYNNEAKDSTEDGVSEQNSDLTSAEAELAVLQEIMDISTAEAEALQKNLEKAKEEYIEAHTAQKKAEKRLANLEAQRDALLAKDPRTPEEEAELARLYDEIRAIESEIVTYKAQRQSAHDEAESLRNSYGYTGDADKGDGENGGFLIYDPIWELEKEEEELPGANYYKINVTYKGNGFVQPSGEFSRMEGSSVKISIFPDSGYVAQITHNGSSPFYVNKTPGKEHEYVLTYNLQSDHTVEVWFVPESVLGTLHLITATAHNGEITPNDEFYVEEGTDLTFTLNPGDQFEKLVDNGVEKSVSSSYKYNLRNISSDHYIEAFFKLTPKKDSYAITATAGDGGAISPSGKTTVFAGKSQGYKITANDGYVIDTIYVDGMPVNLDANSTPSGNNSSGSQTTTIPGNIKDFLNSISNPSNGSVGVPTNPSAPGASNGTATNDEAQTEGSYTFTNVQSDHTIHVTFRKAGSNGTGDDKIDDPDPAKTYTVTFNLNGRGAPKPANQTVMHGGHVAEPATAPTAEGYDFKGWYTDRAGTSKWNFSKDTVTANITLYAKWEKSGSTAPGDDEADDPDPAKTYTVKFDLNGHGAPKPANQTVMHGGNAVEPTPAPTAEGYIFEGWYTDEAGTTKWDFDKDTVTETMTLYAKWTIKTYTVSFDLNGRGSPKPADQTVNHGGKVKAPAPPSAVGLVFGGWYRDSTCTTKWNFSKDKVTSSVTLYAKWTEKPRINNFSAITITPAGKSENTKSGYGIGCEVTLEVENVDDLSKLVVKAYNTATETTFTLEFIQEGDVIKWVMPKNPDSKIKARVDYLPVELPDGEYQFDISVSLDGTVLATKVIKYKVEGVMYEDDFSGDRN